MMKQLLTEWHKHILNEVKPQIKSKVKPQIKTPQAPTPGIVSYSYSPKLIAFLKSKEEFKSKPYKNPGDRPTIGYGTTYYVKNGKEIPVTLNDKPITEKQAERLMFDYLDKIVMPSLNRYLKNKPITQNQVDALASAMYNMGNAKFLNTKLFTVASLNPEDSRVKELFLSDKVATVGGQVSPGLKARRAEEYKMYSALGPEHLYKQSNDPPEEPIGQTIAPIPVKEPDPDFNYFRRY